MRTKHTTGIMNSLSKIQIDFGTRRQIVIMMKRAPFTKWEAQTMLRYKYGIE